jgi:hypothetical protein
MQLYDGKQATWVYEEIVLDNVQNMDIKIRFNLTSDVFTNFDGFYFDDLTVKIIDMSGVGILGKNPPGVLLSDPVPNPADQNVSISYQITHAGNSHLEIYNAAGNIIKHAEIDDMSGKITFSVATLPAGVYFYRLTGSSGGSAVKKLIIIH